jgi:hypothetical protein
VGVMPGAEPFAADGGDVGVVVSHGVTGSPRSLRPWAEHRPLVAADPGRITAPVLTHRGRVEPLSGRLPREGARSAEVTEVILADPRHVAALDDDAPAVVAGSLEWVRQHTSAPAGS